MPDVNPIALHNVANAMLTHPNVFQNYYTVNHMLRDGLPYCGSLCRQVHFCSATQIDYADYDDCIVKALMASSRSSAGALTSRWINSSSTTATWRLLFIFSLHLMIATALVRWQTWINWSGDRDLNKIGTWIFLGSSLKNSSNTRHSVKQCAALYSGLAGPFPFIASTCL